MKKRQPKIAARHLGLIARAFQEIKGPKPIMLAYKIGKILEPVNEMQAEFIARIKPFVNEQGNLLPDLTDEQRVDVEALVNEELTVEIPEITIAELALANKLEISDDSVLAYLVTIGVLVDGAPMLVE